MNDCIRTSRHSIEPANTRKRRDLDRLVDEYRRVASLLVNHLWDNEYQWLDSSGKPHQFCIKTNQLDCPSMLKSDIIRQAGIESWLSGRALKCCMTQVAGMIKAATEKQRKRLYVLSSTPRKNHLLVRKIKQNIPQKPITSNILLELNSVCCDYKATPESKSFDGYLRLKSITKDKTEIRIPVKMHRHSRKLGTTGTMLTSFLIGKSHIDIRWRVPAPEQRTDGAVVGADQGLKTVLTLSDGRTTATQDPHGHTLESIITRLCRRRKGSKGFKRAQEHRKNFINWSINSLDFNGIRQINMENIWNIGYKNRTSKALSHWTNTLIRDKVEDAAMMHGVRVVRQASTYRSQRCSACGLVRKANRKGKTYTCSACGMVLDADLNAARNHAVVGLAEIPYTLRILNLNRRGFYWKPEGLFDSEGRSLQSLPPVEVE